MVLIAGIALLLAVDRAAGGGKDHPAQAVEARRFHQVEHPDQIDLRVVDRVGDRAPHVHLRREMENYLGPFFGDDLRDPLRFAQIGLIEARTGIDLLALASGQIVEHGHRMAGCDQPVGGMGADESGAAGDQNLHQAFLNRAAAD